MLKALLPIVMLCTAALALAQNDAQSHKLSPEKWKKIVDAPKDVKSAACSPATALRDMSWNSVQTLIKSNGAMWTNQAVGRGVYRVPKDQNVSVFYAGALWMGGLSPDQQLKLAGIIYEFGGTDFWPGPLTQVTAETEGEQCNAYDRFWTSYKQDAEIHRSYHECANDPNCDLAEEYPNGYTYPDYFDEWPAHGDVGLGQDFYLSPFFDFNLDGFYVPEDGDYPWFDFLQEIDCTTRRRTDPVPLFGESLWDWASF